MAISLGELATRFGCELVGDPDAVVDRVATLPNAGSGALAFISNPAYEPLLADTSATAVVLREEQVELSPAACLVASDPYLTYARMAALVVPAPGWQPGVHASAVIAGSAEVDASAHIAANAVIGERSKIAANVFVGPGVVIGDDCMLAADSHLHANVTLVRAVQMGERCIVHAGAVIGGDGFGNAMSSDGWVKVPQLGGVRIGADVEIGCNTTIDCGAIDDTVIEDGVRIDNLCMIAHNVHIGAHTALAGMVAFAGSAVIGKRCMFAGKSGTVGHITVCDDVITSGKAMITKDVREPGVYASSFAAEKVRVWNRNVARIRRLSSLFDRVKKLERENQ